jgi:hypothetical protein
MAASAGVQLLVNATATGAQFSWPGGICIFAVAGTFGGASISLNVLGPDGVTSLVAGAATTLTAPGMGVAYLPPCQVQAVITGGAPSGIFASLARVVG